MDQAQGLRDFVKSLNGEKKKDCLSYIKDRYGRGKCDLAGYCHLRDKHSLLTCTTGGKLDGDTLGRRV